MTITIKKTAQLIAERAKPAVDDWCKVHYAAEPAGLSGLAACNFKGNSPRVRRSGYKVPAEASGFALFDPCIGIVAGFDWNMTVAEATAFCQDYAIKRIERNAEAQRVAKLYGWTLTKHRKGGFIISKNGLRDHPRGCGYTPEEAVQTILLYESDDDDDDDNPPRPSPNPVPKDPQFERFMKSLEIA